MIPKFEDFLFPFLNQFKETEIKSKKEITEALISHFQLSEDDIAMKTRAGSSTQLNDRIGWCRQWLRRALFIELNGRAEYKITQRGKDYLNTHTDLRETDLLEYPEFAEYSGVHRKDKQFESCSITDVDVSPTEQLENAYAAIQSDLAFELLEKVMQQSPAFFEQLVVDLLVKMGYGGSFADSARVTQLTNDEGIDGIIYEDKLGLDKIYIQAKRWSNQVSRPNIQQFAGALAGQNATKGVFITTSTFSKDARLFVEKVQQKIVLIDGQELAKYMIEYNVGVSVKKEYIIKRIDSDYFEE